MKAPRFEILKPSTSEDDGSPTGECYRDMERVFRLIEDERHLIAMEVYQSVLARLHDAEEEEQTKAKRRFTKTTIIPRQKSGKEKDLAAAQELINSRSEELEKLEVSIFQSSLFSLIFQSQLTDSLQPQQRCALFAKARDNLIDTEDWTLAQTMFGITTYYRREADSSLSIKMEGKLDGVSLFDQVAVLREVDLHYTWAPFVSSSLTIAHLNKLDTVGWFVVGLPSFGLMRDACFRALGCDSMLEDGSVLLVAQGVADKHKDGVKTKTTKVAQGAAEMTVMQQQAKDFEFLSKDAVLQELDLPAPPKGMGSGRMTIRAFQALINIESPTSASTTMIANVDPNLPFVPQSLLDFLMKKLCGVLLYKLQHAAKRISKDPIYNPHASKMRQEEHFYKNWLLEKFKAVCRIRNWTMPPITSLDLTDQQMELAVAADEKKHKNKTHKTMKYYHSLSQDKLEDFLEPDITTRSEPAQIGQRTPKVSALPTDSSSVISDISRNSSSSTSLWQSNPISKYLRDVEEKTELRKAREVQRARERAAKRLKPKRLDATAKKRLQELREARNKNRPSIMKVESDITQRSIDEAQPTSSPRGKAAASSGHWIFVRFLSIFLLTALLFVLLYMDPKFESLLTRQEDDYWMAMGQNGIVVAYMLLTSTVHFCLCYVALVYMFSALQIGAVAGKQAKRFYKKNMHVLVFLFSYGLTLVGMIKAGIIVLARYSVIGSSIMLNGVKNLGSGVSTDILTRIPDGARSSFEPAMSALQAAYSALADSSSKVARVLVSALITSNPLGKLVKASLLGILHPFISLLEAAQTFSEETLVAHAGEIELKEWRVDAYETTRALLAHSAVFVVTVLSLYYLTTLSSVSSGSRLGRKDSHPAEDISTCSTAGFSKSATGASRASRKRSQSRSPSVDTIEE